MLIIRAIVGDAVGRARCTTRCFGPAARTTPNGGSKPNTQWRAGRQAANVMVQARSTGGAIS